METKRSQHSRFLQRFQAAPYLALPALRHSTDPCGREPATRLNTPIAPSYQLCPALQPKSRNHLQIWQLVDGLPKELSDWLAISGRLLLFASTPL